MDREQQYRKVLILGDIPIAQEIYKFYYALQYEVVYLKDFVETDFNIIEFDELFLLVKADGDCKALAMLYKLIGSNYNYLRKGGRLLCHLLLQERDTFRMIQACDFSDIIRGMIDVYPFTMTEVWSRSIVLDYEPITIHSDKHVHLVIFGMGEMAEIMAIQAAHKAHYPNYVDPRITVIS